MAESNSRITSKTFDLKEALKPGWNTIVVVVDNYDLYAKGGMGLAKQTYPESKGLKPVSFYYSDQQTNLDKLQNESTSFPSEISLIRWGKITFELPATAEGIQVPWILRLKASDNCKLFLNDHLIGRYWKNGRQNDFYLPECWLNIEQQNIIKLQMMNDDRKAAVEYAEIIPSSAYATYKQR